MTLSTKDKQSYENAGLFILQNEVYQSTFELKKYDAWIGLVILSLALQEQNQGTLNKDLAPFWKGTFTESMQHLYAKYNHTPPAWLNQVNTPMVATPTGTSTETPSILPYTPPASTTSTSAAAMAQAQSFLTKNKTYIAVAVSVLILVAVYFFTKSKN